MALPRWFSTAISTAALAACASHAPLVARSSNAVGSGAQASAATIQIEYARPGDSLRLLTVTKFAEAHAIALKDEKRAEIFRFEGGVPVWEIHANPGLGGELLDAIPGIGTERKLRLRAVSYGVLPDSFMQTTPDSGLPEPLETDKFYVVRVERSSGSISYQAMRLYPDGKIEAYDAEPRAGESYALCCNVSETFSAITVP